MKHTTVHTRQDISQAITHIRDHLIATLDISDRQTLCGLSERALLHTSLQVLFTHKFNDSLTRKIYEVFLQLSADAERKSPGSTLLFAKLLTKHDTLQSETRNVSRQCVRADVLARIDTIVSDASIREAVKQAITLAGFQGKVLVEKSPSDCVVVEKSSGYTFLSKRLLMLCQSVHVSPRVLVIDGYIESVSEIHQLLQDSAETKEHVFLFCRGMSDDVFSTVNANNVKGILTLVPYVFKFDVSTLNVLNDLAVVCGTDVISTNKGQLVSSAKLCEAPSVDKITVYGDRFIISNRRTRQNVKAHVKLLSQKRDQQHVIENVFSERIRCLTDSCVNIKLPDNQSYVTNSQSIDYVLRSLSKMSLAGVISHSNVPEFVGELTDTASAALAAYASFTQTVESLGASVISC